MAYARILRAPAASRGAPLFSSIASDGRRRRVTLEELEGRRTAERLVQQARTDARALLDRAAQDAKQVAEQAALRAEADARAREVARWLVQRSAEQRTLEKDRERLIAVAVALAERLLGASLELDPARVAEMARAVLAEARGARRVLIEAHPLDAGALREHVTAADLDVQTVDVRDDAGLARGDLLLHTDLGTIDAKLALRFDRLAAALRDALG